MDTNTRGNDTYTVYSYGTGNAWTMQTDQTIYNGTTIDGANLQTTTHYDYNLQGQMTKATVKVAVSGNLNTTSTSTYTYNPDGIRTGQSVIAGGSTTNTTYLIDSNNPTGYAQVLNEFVNGTLSKTYTLGLDVISQWDSTHATLTFLYDGHGSTRALINTLAQVIQRFAYDAFGNSLTATNLTAQASALTTLLYSGEQTDAATGLQYLRARYYSERMGRFTSSDSYAGNSSDPSSFHKYLYANGNPIRFTDPTGHFSFEELTVTQGIILGLNGLIVASGIKSAVSAVKGYAPLVSPQGISPEVKDFAHLANDSYDDHGHGWGPWKPVKEWSGGPLGFSARLYSDGSSYALAFRGTEWWDPLDWLSNVAQAFTGPDLTEYGDAINLGREVSAEVGAAKLTMVGHSLGGGMAAAAAFATNRPAVTFNAAGMSYQTQWEIGGSYSSLTVNYRVRGEILTGLQRNVLGMRGAFGTQYDLLPGPAYIGSAGVTLHGMASVLNALGD